MAADIFGLMRDLLREEWKVLAKGKPPDIEPGNHCTKPFTCEFYNFCNKLLPVDHVTNLPGITPKSLEELTRQGIQSIFTAWCARRMVMTMARTC